MLCLDVRSLAQHAASVAADLPATDPLWDGADVRPSSAVHVAGRVSAAGGGRYYWSGRIEGTAEQFCTRCLDPVKVTVSEDVRALFAEPGVDEQDDPDVYVIDPAAGIIDLRPAVREHWILNVPRYALCREDCKGLCPRCGENLNTSKCVCQPAMDSQWDALRAIRQD